MAAFDPTNALEGLIGGALGSVASVVIKSNVAPDITINSGNSLNSCGPSGSPSRVFPNNNSASARIASSSHHGLTVKVSGARPPGILAVNSWWVKEHQYIMYSCALFLTYSTPERAVYPSSMTGFLIISFKDFS